MRKRIALIFLVFVSCSFSALGQAAETPNQHQWYAGIQMSSHYYAVIFPSGLPSMSDPGSIKPTIGYYLSPRWAIQLSGLHHNREINSSGSGTNELGEPTTFSWVHKNWNNAISADTRLTLTKKTNQRLKVDGVIGISFINIRFTSQRIFTENGVVRDERMYGERTTGTYLTGGLSGRLGMGKTRRTEIVADLLVNRNTQTYSKAVYQYLDAPGGLTRAYGLGLRYRFW